MTTNEPKKAKKDDGKPERPQAEVIAFISDPRKEKDKKPPRERKPESMIFSTDHRKKKGPEIVPNPDPVFPERPFDPYVQRVIDSVRDQIEEKTGIQRDHFEGLRFCQYVREEMAYYVKFHQVDDMYMHVKIAKPFVPTLEDKWEVPFEVTDFQMDKGDEDKLIIWDKDSNALDRERRRFFYDETWDAKEKELGVARLKINHRDYELLAALDPV